MTKGRSQNVPLPQYKMGIKGVMLPHFMSSIEKEESKKSTPHFHNKNKTNMMPRKPLLKRYQKIFLGHCYSCNNFGHKALDCKAYQKHNQQYSYNNSNPSDNPRSKSYNSFAPLQKYDVEFHKCNNYGHIARLCRNGGISNENDGNPIVNGNQ